MSWLSHKLMKSASKDTGVFSWGKSIPLWGDVIGEAQKHLDKKAKKEGIGAYEVKKTAIGMPLGENTNLIIVGLAIAYFMGLF